MNDIVRCAWAKTEPNLTYHDTEWGVPVHDDRLLFEFLILEGAQAGLSWETVLKKRENYRAAYDGFEIAKIARYGQRQIDALLGNPGIIRNRLKVAASIANAQAALRIQDEFGSLDRYLWSFTGGSTISNSRKSFREVPAQTPQSDAMSKDLLKRGFKFVGSTILYAFMQAVGIVNDHTIDCFRHRELAAPKTTARKSKRG